MDGRGNKGSEYILSGNLEVERTSLRIEALEYEAEHTVESSKMVRLSEEYF